MDSREMFLKDSWFQGYSQLLPQVKSITQRYSVKVQLYAFPLHHFLTSVWQFWLFSGLFFSCKPVCINVCCACLFFLDEQCFTLYNTHSFTLLFSLNIVSQRLPQVYWSVACSLLKLYRYVVVNVLKSYIRCNSYWGN